MSQALPPTHLTAPRAEKGPHSTSTHIYDRPAPRTTTAMASSAPAAELRITIPIARREPSTPR